MKVRISWPDLILGIGIGIMLGVILNKTTAKAHPPCEEDYQPPQCGYVQVVNPITGFLEQQYICE